MSGGWYSGGNYTTAGAPGVDYFSTVGAGVPSSPYDAGVAPSNVTVGSTSPPLQCACGNSTAVALDLPLTKNVFALHDVTGDGLADYIVAVQGGVNVYQNKGYANGTVWFATTPVQVTVNSLLGWGGNNTPTQLYFADMDGSGTDDIIVQEVPYESTSTNATYLGYVNLFGGVKPGVLTGIATQASPTDTTVTSATQIVYESMPELESDASIWTMHSPQSVHAVKSLTVSDSTGDSYTTTYTYWNPVFDARENQFLGFQRVRETSPGTAAILSNTETTYFYGACGAETGVSCNVGSADYPLASYRGIPTLVEVFDGVAQKSRQTVSPTYLSTTHHAYATKVLYTGSDDRVVRRLYEPQTDTFVYDTAPFAATVQSASIPDTDMPGVTSPPVPIRAVGAHRLQKATALDAFGNINSVADNGDVTASPPDSPIVKATTWEVPQEVLKSGNRWTWRPSSTSVGASATDPNAAVSTYQYDALGDATDVYQALSGTAPLYHPAGSPAPVGASQDAGTVHSAHIVYDATTGNVTQVMTYPYNSSGDTSTVRCTEYSYDPKYSQLRTTETLDVGACQSAQTITTQHVIDRVLEVETATIAPGGQRSAKIYDGVGRVTSISKPNPNLLNLGQTSLTPSATFSYQDTDYGQLIVEADAAGSTAIAGGTATVSYAAKQTYTYLDGFGRTIQVLSSGDAGNQWILSGQIIRDSRGRVTSSFVPTVAAMTCTGCTLGSAPTLPSGSATGTTYDAFGRVTESTDIDGTITFAARFHALSAEARDAEQVAASGPHISAYALTTHDGHGRTVEVDQFGNGGEISTVSTYRATGEYTQNARAGTDNSRYALN